MFYKVELQDHIRVPPIYFGKDVNEAVAKSIKQKYAGFMDQDVGIVIDVVDVKDIGEGVVLPGDGASHYETTFELLVFKPELQEAINGRIKDITDFGAFITLGPIDGMIHVSQTMDDFVTISKEKVLFGRDSKKFLKVGDICRSRIIAVSFKDPMNPKIALTMRQQGLGKLEWLEEKKEIKEISQPVKKESVKKGKK